MERILIFPEYNVGSSNKEIKLKVLTDTDAGVAISAAIDSLNGSAPKQLDNIKANAHGQVSPAKKIGIASKLEEKCLDVHMTLYFDLSKFDDSAIKQALKQTDIDIILSGGEDGEHTYGHMKHEIKKGSVVTIGGKKFLFYTYNKTICLI